MASIPIVQTPDRLTNQLQSNLIAAINSTNMSINTALNDGVFLTGINLSIGSNTITHTLGNTPTGFIVTDIQTAAPSFYRTAWNANSITLQASVASTVSLYVF